MSQEEVRKKIAQFLFKWKDLTSLGVPSSSLGTIFGNETLYQHSPKRFNFYMQVLESISNPDPSVLETVIKKENQSRFQREKVKGYVDDIVAYFKKTKLDKDTLVKNVNQALSSNIMTQGYTATAGAGGSDAQTGGDKPLLESLRTKLFGNKNIPLTKQFEKKVNAINADPAADKLTLQEELDGILKTYQEDPYVSPDNEKLTWADRAIFIALTYIIRALALFLTEWAIYSGFIKSFTAAFNIYFGMYVCIFFLTVFLTNAKKDDMVFRLIFFYMNSMSDGGKGTLRIIVHFICILMLVPIPYIVKDFREFNQPSVLSFTDKTNILRGVETFSLYTWILTSIVALNM